MWAGHRWANGWWHRGGNKEAVPAFHGQFTVDRKWTQTSANPTKEKVEKFTLDLQATRASGEEGWYVTGSAAVQTVTLIEAGVCAYTATGSQQVEGEMLDPLDSNFVTDFKDGFVVWQVFGTGTVSTTNRSLGGGYPCDPIRFWSASLSIHEGTAGTCTVSERDSTYNSHGGFNYKLAYTCSSTTSGVTETETGQISGAWLPN